MTSWMSNISLRRLSGTVFSGHQASNKPSNDTDPVFVSEPDKQKTQEQVDAESTMNQFIKRRRELIDQRRKDYERRKQEEQQTNEYQVDGPEDGFTDVHDISPPTKKQPSTHVSDVVAKEDCDEIIQELELIHFLLTELNQRKNKRAPVKELRAYLMMFYSNLILFIRNRDEPLNYKFSARNNKKTVEEKFDDKLLHVIDDYIKSNIFGLLNGGLFLSKETMSNFHEIEGKLCEGMDTGLRNKVLEMLKMANSCLTLHQILDGVKKNHQYLVSLRLKTVGAVRDFLLQYPRDFAVIDEMVCSVKDSKFDYSKLPPLEEIPEQKPRATAPRSCLKRSVSFVDRSMTTPKSTAIAPVVQSDPKPQNVRAAFSMKTKVAVADALSDHGANCVCEKLVVCKNIASLKESDIIQFNQRCLVASFMKIVQEMSKRSDHKEASCQTIISFDPNEDI